MGTPQFAGYSLLSYTTKPTSLAMGALDMEPSQMNFDVSGSRMSMDSVALFL